MKKLLHFTLIVSLLVTGLCPNLAASTPPKVPAGWFNGGANFMRAMELHVQLKVPMVIYFYTDWCPYCQELEQDYFPHPAMREYLSSVVKIRINPELTRQDREVAEMFGITGFPSFFVASPEGSPVRVSPYLRNGGALTPAEFAERCRNVAAPATAKPPQIIEKPQPVVVGGTRTVETSAPKLGTNSSLATADAVLTKYAQITGTGAGRVTSRVIKGRINVPGLSVGGRFEFYATAGGKSLTMISVDRVGIVKQGFDGRSGWTASETATKGASLPENVVLAVADFYRDAKLNELYPKTKLLGKAKEGDRDVYIVEATPRAGGTAETLYFDALTGLLIHRDFSRGSERGPIQSEIYFSDWRDVDGFRLPCSMTQMIGNLTFVITVDEIKHNIAIDDAVFQRPSR